MPIVYATSVKRWTNDHRVAGAPYLLTTEALADAHVRAGWATREPPRPERAGGHDEKAAVATPPPSPLSPPPAKKATGSSGRSNVLIEGDLSAVPSEQSE